MLKVRILRGTAKKWLMEDSPWYLPLFPLMVVLLGSPERQRTLNERYAGGFLVSTDFTATRIANRARPHGIAIARFTSSPYDNIKYSPLN